MFTLDQSASTLPLNFENLLGFAALSFMNSPHFFSTLFFRWNTSFFSVGVAVQHRPDDSVPRSVVTTCWHLSSSFLPTITDKVAPGPSCCLLSPQWCTLLLNAGPYLTTWGFDRYFSASIKIKKWGFVYACFAEDPLCDPGSVQRRVLLFISLYGSSPFLLCQVNGECSVFVCIQVIRWVRQPSGHKPNKSSISERG